MQRKISFLVAPGFELLDLSGPLCAFNVAKYIHHAPYDINIISAAGGPVCGTSGISIDTKRSSAGVQDTVIVVGGPYAHRAGHHPPTSAMLAALAPNTRRLASVCTGAFYLAEAGILNDRRATTHWRYAPLLQARFPRISVDADRIFINDDHIWTSAGISAGIDLALAMIEADFGHEESKATARELVVYHRRPGGQAQFSAILSLEPASTRVRDALTYARENLHGDLSVERLAEAACISSRQFARIFQKETGETPARAVERLRLEVAKPLVEEGREPLEAIARQVGFQDVERMRRSFLKFFGQSPQTVRRTARANLRAPE